MEAPASSSSSSNISHHLLLEKPSQQLRNTKCTVLLDGFEFEGSDWRMIKFHGNFLAKGLQRNYIQRERSNHFKARPELAGKESILLPIWINSQEPSVLYVCWRGDPNDAFKNEALKGKSKKAYDSLPGILRALLEKSIKELKSGRTYDHYMMNSDPNNDLEVCSAADYNTIATAFSASKIFEEFTTQKLEPYFFKPNTSEVVFAVHRRGDNKVLEDEASMERTLMREVFPTIQLGNCTHGAVHWAWDFEDARPMENHPDCQAFFDPNKLKSNLGIPTDAGGIFYTRFCTKPLASDKAAPTIGNVQWKVPPNDQGVREINVYKKTLVNDFKANPTFKISQAGIGTFLRSDVLAPLLTENLGRTHSWVSGKEPPAVTGPQRSLVEQTVDENLLALCVEVLNYYYKHNTQCRVEIISNLCLVKDAQYDRNPIMRSFDNSSVWAREHGLLPPNNYLVQVKNNVSDSSYVGIHHVVDLVLDAYRKRVVNFVEKVHSIFQRENLLETNARLEPFDLAACTVAEVLLFKYLCGRDPSYCDDVGKRTKKIFEWIRSNLDEETSAEENIQSIKLDAVALKLLDILKNPTKEQQDKISMDMLGRDHLIFYPSVQALLSLRDCWDQLQSLKPLTRHSAKPKLADFMEAFIRFALLAHWNTTKMLPHESVELFELPASNKAQFDHVEEKVSPSQKADSNNVAIVQFHTVKWLFDLMESQAGLLLPQQSSVWYYKFAKTCFRDLGEINEKDLLAEIWNESFISVCVRCCLSCRLPYAVGIQPTCMDADQKINLDDLLALELEYRSGSPTALAKQTSADVSSKPGPSKVRKQRPIPSKKAKAKIVTNSFGALLILPTLKDLRGDMEVFTEICFKSVIFGQKLNPEQMVQLFSMFQEKLRHFHEQFPLILEECRLFVITLHLIRATFISHTTKSQKPISLDELFPEMRKELRIISASSDPSVSASLELTLREEFGKFWE